MFGLSIINLCFADVSTRYVLLRKVPSWTVIGSSNCAKDVPPISTTLVEVTLSGIEKRYVVFSELPTQTSPALSFKNFVVLSFVAPTFISLSRIVAVAAVFELGT